MRLPFPVKIALWTAGPVLLCGLAVFLGWLKTLYYFKAFGVGLSGLDLSPGGYALESWFVLQNLLFFVLLWWVVLEARRVWAVAVGIVYALIPLGAHYAFALGDWAPAGWLIHYRHTLLKIVPFALLAGVWLLQPRFRERMKRPSWRLGSVATAVAALLTLSWAVSSAKHFGSFDANLAIRRPEAHLLRLRVPPGASAAAPGLTADNDELFLIHADQSQLIVWDRSGFTPGPGAPLRIVVVRRDRVDWFEGSRPYEVQPGSRFL